MVSRSLVHSIHAVQVGRQTLQKRWIWAGLNDTRCFSRVRRQKYFPDEKFDSKNVWLFVFM